MCDTDGLLLVGGLAYELPATIRSKEESVLYSKRKPITRLIFIPVPEQLRE